MMIRLKLVKNWAISSSGRALRRHVGEVGENMNGYVYILKSLKNGRYYVGSTINVPQRLGQHNSGKVKATRNIRPLKLEFSKLYISISEARKIEYRIKKLKRRDYIEKIIRDKNIRLGH